MSQPVKLSDALVLDARIAAEAQQRSIAGQVEFWARLGRSVEPLLNGRQVLELHKARATQSLSEALASVDTPAGRQRVADVIASRPYPHYKQSQVQPGLLVRIDEDGTETVGRFENRTFVAVSSTAESHDQPKSTWKRRIAKRKAPRTTEKAQRQPKEQESWA
jgi:hypothetical protein